MGNIEVTEVTKGGCMRIVSAYVKTFLDSNTVLGIYVTYENNTTEWLTEEEFNAIKQDGNREAQEQGSDQEIHQCSSASDERLGDSNGIH